MVLIGFLHALLLFSGDIVGAYGLLAVLLAGLLIRAGDRTLLVMAGLWTVPIVVFHTLGGRLSPPGAGSGATAEPLQAAGIRVLEWVHRSIVGSVFLLVPAVLVGVWAARRRLLDDPERHRQSLRRAAVLGVGIAAVGGLPWALVKAHWWVPSPAAATFADLTHTITGYPGGMGYAAIAGLIAIRSRPGRITTALVACGQRSLTCCSRWCSWQCWPPTAEASGIGSGSPRSRSSPWRPGYWTVLLAEFMRRAGYRGPAEVLLRRLTYRPIPSPRTSSSG